MTLTADAAWRSFTGAVVPPNEITLTGPAQLTEPLLSVRGIITQPHNPGP